MGKKVDLSDFKCCMVVGARRAGLSVSETDDLLGFTKNGLKKRKCAVSSSSVNQNALLMPLK